MIGISHSPPRMMRHAIKVRSALLFLVLLCAIFLVLFGVLKFRSPNPPQGGSAIATEAQAAAAVRALPEVVDYQETLAKVGATAHVDAQSEDTQWVVQVYEVKDGHTATFNWYTVDKATGKIATEFP